MAKQALDGADHILLFYLNEVAPVVTHNTTDVPFTALLEKRLPKEDAQLIGETRTLLYDIMDAFFSASQDIKECFGVASSSLNAFVKIIDKNAAQGILSRAFHNDKLRDAQKKLEETSTHFKAATEKMNIIKSQFENKSGENNEAILNLSKNLIDLFEKGYTNVDALVEKVKDEIKVIDNLKSQIEKSKSFTINNDVAELRDSVVQSAQKFIADYTEHSTAIAAVA